MAEEKQYMRGQVVEGDDGYEWQFLGGDQTKRANWRRGSKLADSQTEDVIMSAATGLPQGLEVLGNLGKEGLMSLLPVPIREMARRGVESIPRLRAPQYEPKTTAGRYTQAGTRGAVAGIPFGGTGAALGLGALTGATGALGGEAASDITGGNYTFNVPGQLGLTSNEQNPLGVGLTVGPSHPIDVARVAGEFAGGWLPNLRPSTIVASKRIREATGHMNEADWRAGIQAEEAANSLGLRPSGPQVLNNPTLKAQQLILEQNPRTGPAMQQFNEQQPAQVAAAVRNQLDQLGPAAPDPRRMGVSVQKGAEAKLETGRKFAEAQAKPSYTATITPHTMPDVGIPNRPSTQSALQAVPENIRQNKQITYAISKVLHSPESGLLKGEPKYSAATLDAASKWLRSAEEVALRAGDATTAGLMGSARRQIQAHMDANMPDYQIARRAYERGTAAEVTPRRESLTGQLAETSDPTAQFNAIRSPDVSRPGVIGQTLEDLRTEGVNVPSFLRTGLENEFDQAARLFKETGEQSAAGRFVRRMRETKQTRENIEAAISKVGGKGAVAGWNKLLDSLQIMDNRLSTGSRTAFNQAQMENMNASMARDFLSDPTSLNLPTKWLDRVLNNMTAEQMQKVFTSPNSVKAIRELGYTRLGTARARVLMTTILNELAQEPAQ